MKRKEGRGFWAKLPSFFFLTMDKIEEAMGGGSDLGPVALGARRRSGSGGKRRGGRGGPIPLLTSGGGGLWRAGDGGWRRWPAMAVAAALQTWGGGKRW